MSTDKGLFLCFSWNFKAYTVMFPLSVADFFLARICPHVLVGMCLLGLAVDPRNRARVINYYSAYLYVRRIVEIRRGAEMC